MNRNKPIVIVGAGACGLVAARELSRAGKKVILVEARDRVGGRIFPLSQNLFGYPAQAGAEFIHGQAKLTKSLMREAGLTYISVTGGTFWHFEKGELYSNKRGEKFDNDMLQKKLRELKEDMPIATFFEKNFPEKKFLDLKKSVFQMVERYDAADPLKISTFALRKDWLGGKHKWTQGRIKEGYGALLKYLGEECRKNNLQILLNHEVASIAMSDAVVRLDCTNNKSIEGKKTIITVPIALISRIKFIPNLPEVVDAGLKLDMEALLSLSSDFNQHGGGK